MIDDDDDSENMRRLRLMTSYKGKENGNATAIGYTDFLKESENLWTRRKKSKKQEIKGKIRGEYGGISISRGR